MAGSVDTEGTWLNRELAGLREREARYRQQLGKHWATTSRLHEYTRSLHSLMRRSPSVTSHLTATLMSVARLSAQALEVERSSVWLLNAAGDQLVCAVELRGSAEVEPALAPIVVADCPAYFASLQRDTAVPVEDARSDPRTRELKAYLETHDVGALLDIPVLTPDGLLGVVCHEHLGTTRVWEASEVDFATNVGDLVALTLQTERKLLAQREAKGLEAKYQHLIESLPVTLYSFDYQTSKLTYVSPQGVALGEFESQQSLLAQGAQAWIDRVHPEDRPGVAKRLTLGGVSGGLPAEVKYRILLPSGGMRWVRDIGSVVRGVDGRPVSVQGILCDITDQMEARSEQREFERRYRSLLENTDLVAVTLDTRGQVTFANTAMLRLAACDEAEILGRDWFELMLPEATRERVKARYLRDVESGAIRPRFEIEVQSPSGKRHLLLCANTLLRGRQGEPAGSATLALDITRSRALDHALLEQTKLEALGRLAAGVAHDFNNLLVVLMAQSSLLRETLPEASEPQLQTIDDALSQAAELTRTLLTYGRRQPRRSMRVAVDKLLQDTLPLLRAMVNPASQLSSELHATGAQVRGDGSALKQAVINLVGNADDALRERGGNIRLSSHVELLAKPEARAKGLRAGIEHVVIRVEDDGPGISSEELGRIFEPFHTTKPDGVGTGLGLAIVRSVVQDMGGAVEAQSRPDEGATFCIYLPVEGAAANLPRTQTNGRPQVLVVEGDHMVRGLVCRALVSQGYDAVPAEDLETARQSMAAGTPDLLVASAQLGDGPGVILARTARSLRPDLPVILLGDAGQAEEFYEYCLPRPLDLARLSRAVREALSHPQGRI